MVVSMRQLLRLLAACGMVHACCGRIVKAGEHQYVLHYTDGSGAEQSLPCALVMMATGRKPRVDGIGLEVRSGGWRRGGGGRKERRGWFIAAGAFWMCAPISFNWMCAPVPLECHGHALQPSWCQGECAGCTALDLAVSESLWRDRGLVHAGLARHTWAYTWAVHPC